MWSIQVSSFVAVREADWQPWNGATAHSPGVHRGAWPFAPCACASLSKFHMLFDPSAVYGTGRLFQGCPKVSQK